MKTFIKHLGLASRKSVLIGMHRIIFNTYSFVYMLSEWNEREREGKKVYLIKVALCLT